MSLLKLKGFRMNEGRHQITSVALVALVVLVLLLLLIV